MQHYKTNQSHYQTGYPGSNYNYPSTTRPSRSRPKRKNGTGCTCAILATLILCLLIFPITTVLVFPIKTNILLLGIDYAPAKSYVGRSDTIILLGFRNPPSRVTLLSIPRDLWVQIPGFGENRINTAHFFSEGQTPGQGPITASATIKENFGINPQYFIRFRFDNVREIVNAMGGVTIELNKPTAGYPPGVHYLTGRKALAFTRNRTGSDDFFRMEQGQILIKAIIHDLLKPTKWLRWPAVIITILRNSDTNIPPWTFVQLGVLILLKGPNNIQNYIINREMTSPFITNEGANVLLPNWDIIRPFVESIFNK